MSARVAGKQHIRAGLSLSSTSVRPPPGVGRIRAQNTTVIQVPVIATGKTTGSLDPHADVRQKEHQRVIVVKITGQGKTKPRNPTLVNT